MLSNPTGSDGIAFTIGADRRGPPLRLLQSLVRQLYQGEEAEFTVELGMLEAAGAGEDLLGVDHGNWS